MSSLSANAAASGKKDVSGEEAILVAIRLRPLTAKQASSSCDNGESLSRRVWKALKKHNAIAQTTIDGKPLEDRKKGRNFFEFDRVFGEDSNTQQVYKNTAGNIVNSVVTGKNGTIFAYGQTSSGKTFTMQGGGMGSSIDGIVQLAARDMFSLITTNVDRVFLLRVSFIEIYNEEVRDLLVSGGETKALAVREDPIRGVFVNSNETIVTDHESLSQVLFSGEKNRMVASTGMNDRSSRSHTIFRITVESKKREKSSESEDEDSDRKNESNDEENESSKEKLAEDGAVRVSTLNLVDLAGSESVRHTGATGDRQKEGGKINQSLLTLSRVIAALGQPSNTHVNFRDSKLTRILQPSLSGNARMAVICCATPSDLYIEETRSTLQFASRAKLVKTSAKVNERIDDRTLIKRLQKELEVMRQKLSGTDSIATTNHSNELIPIGQSDEEVRKLKAIIRNDTLKCEEKKPFAFDSSRRKTLGALTFLDLNISNGANLHDIFCHKKKKKKRYSEGSENKLQLDTHQSFLAKENMFKEALVMKSKSVRGLENKISHFESALQKSQSDLTFTQISKDALQSNATKEIEEEKFLADERIAEIAASLNDMNTELSDCTEKYEGQIADLMVKLSSKGTQEVELLTETSGANVDIATLRVALEEVNYKARSIEVEKEELKSCLEKTMEDLDVAQTKKLQNALELAGLRERLDLKESELSDVQQKLSGIQQKLENATSEEEIMDSKVQSLLQSLEASEKKICDLETKIILKSEETMERIADHCTEADAAQARIESMVADKESTEKLLLESQRKSILTQAEIERLSSENAKLLERAEESSANINVLISTKSLLEDEAIKLNNKIVEKQSELQTLTLENEALRCLSEESRKTLEDKISQLECNVMDKQAELTDLRAVSDSSILALKDDLSKVETKAIAYNCDLEEKRREAKSTAIEMDDNKAMLDLAEKKIEKLRLESDVKISNLSDLLKIKEAALLSRDEDVFVLEQNMKTAVKGKEASDKINDEISSSLDESFEKLRSIEAMYSTEAEEKKS